MRKGYWNTALDAEENDGIPVDPTEFEVDANADTDVTFPMGPRQVTMKAKDYMMGFAFPNFYFHATTAYGLCRHRGVEVGKRDFLGKIVGFPAA